MAADAVEPDQAAEGLGQFRCSHRRDSVDGLSRHPQEDDALAVRCVSGCTV